MVPDDSLTIRERAIAAWPPAWHGQNLRDILVTLGYDVDRPWRDLPQKDRDWILFTDEQPPVPVYAGCTPAETRRALKRKEEPSYHGHLHQRPAVRAADVRHHRERDRCKKRVARYLVSTDCPVCQRQAAAARGAVGHVRRAGHRRDVPAAARAAGGRAAALRRRARPPAGEAAREHPEKAVVAQRIAEDAAGADRGRCSTWGWATCRWSASTPTLSPGELQRLRLATQVRSNLFGVVYVLDEPSAGLHPADTEALLAALDRLKAAGNSLFVVEHEVDVIRHADWIVDVGPAAGEQGGRVLYSGPPAG